MSKEPIRFILFARDKIVKTPSDVAVVRTNRPRRLVISKLISRRTAIVVRVIVL